MGGNISAMCGGTGERSRDQPDGDYYYHDLAACGSLELVYKGAGVPPEHSSAMRETLPLPPTNSSSPAAGAEAAQASACRC